MSKERIKRIDAFLNKHYVKSILIMFAVFYYGLYIMFSTLVSNGIQNYGHMKSDGHTEDVYMTLIEDNETEIKYQVDKINKAYGTGEASNSVIRGRIGYIEALIIEAEDIIKRVDLNDDEKFYEEYHSNYLKKINEYKDSVKIYVE